MSRALFVAAVVAVVAAAACSSFSEATTPAPVPDGGAPSDASADAGASGDADVDAAPSAPFCPATGAFFCSDFEDGLLKSWLPDSMPPTNFLSLAQAPGHGNVLRAALDAASRGIDRQVVLSKKMTRPASVTYALDLRVEQSGTQLVEVASLRTTTSSTITAFHVGIQTGGLYFAEYAKGATKDYNEVTVAPLDAAWHRIQVTVVYEPKLEVAVRVDGASIIARRAIVVGPVAALTPDVVLDVGVNDIASIAGPLTYLVDNVTLSTP